MIVLKIHVKVLTLKRGVEDDYSEGEKIFLGHIPITHTHSPTNHNPITSSHRCRSVSLNSNNLITSSHLGRSVSLNSNHPISSSHRGRSVSLNSNSTDSQYFDSTPITSSHCGRSVSLNSKSTDSRCFDSTPITLNPCSRNVWVNSDPIDSNYNFDMISNSERDWIFLYRDTLLCVDHILYCNTLCG